jgi:Mg2+ and Co2+ transporter CorA
MRGADQLAITNTTEWYQSEWVVQDFDDTSSMVNSAPGSNSASKPWSGCFDCKSGVRYNSISAALEHLHTQHFDSKETTTHPFNDPCYVWVCRFPTQHPPRHRRYNEILTIAEDFVNDMGDLVAHTKELHYLVARVWSQPGEESMPPPLPVNLASAFKEIIYLYSLTSKQFALTNQSLLSDDASKESMYNLRRKIRAIDNRREDTFRRTKRLFEDAKEDIILLGNSTGDIETLGIESVGAEFIVMALIDNLQSKPVQTDPMTDIVHVYRQYTGKLRFQANRRPKRRVFLDIHALEEELVAIRGVNTLQQNMLEDYLTILYPGSFRITNTDRARLYQVENRYIQNRLSELQVIYDDLEMLHEKSGDLKEQVKQTIEVLEENHGKAIRVFTVVTLFFLPLSVLSNFCYLPFYTVPNGITNVICAEYRSFISSFMGMNTIDIRNIEYDQTFFWIISIPVTLFVVVIAFAYGYKGDEISDWLTSKFSLAPPNHQDHQIRQRVDAEHDDMHGLLQADTELVSPHKTLSNSGQFAWKREIKHSPLHQHRKGNAFDIARRQTGDSLYL